MLLTSEKERLAYRAGFLKGYEACLQTMRDALGDGEKQTALEKSLEFAFPTRAGAQVWLKNQEDVT